ncbi:hypothetical protein UNPF46_20425 [Bradyrhizobium sp. UNPF46]|uniref:DUF2087 domain-containing protein n=1 Tax=Bradyrhizobium sp. UNPF46 TaxID=1141168 RepID=UPI00114E973D|nr:DUF2087 domain-containing protein [Bradyrhizobium sp. UNPF46]TQF37081.1 hypothetical protein UNPF46_20425 [Bradyrhizobium sp. UNPF46]
MARTPIAFVAGDISALAKSVRAQLLQRTSPPGHVELLNILARATGHRNYQHFRAGAACTSADRGAPAVQREAVDLKRVQRAARHFDEHGRLLRWPARHNLQQLSLWVLWAGFPPRCSLAEPEVKTLLNSRHAFADDALLRRALCDHGLVSRTADGRAYRRIERQPPLEATALLRHLKAGAAEAAT